MEREFVDKQVTSSKLRPDFILHLPEQVVLLEVKCPFDSNLSLSLRLGQIQEKYSNLIPDYQRKYPSKEIVIMSFVVGVLGSWGPCNADTLSLIGYSPAEIENIKTQLMLQNITSAMHQWAAFAAKQPIGPPALPAPADDMEDEIDEDLPILHDDEEIEFLLRIEDEIAGRL